LSAASGTAARPLATSLDRVRGDITQQRVAGVEITDAHRLIATNDSD
jgi:hypothetical protein